MDVHMFICTYTDMYMRVKIKFLYLFKKTGVTLFQHKVSKMFKTCVIQIMHSFSNFKNSCL